MDYKKKPQMGNMDITKKHVVTEGETLGDISLKYYGSVAKDKWMAIYEANKAVIGEDPNKIKPGMKLVIPGA